MNDTLGDRMKEYERRETERRFLPLLPIYARIDGRNFSLFTRHMDRPYDDRMTSAMIETTRRVVEETDALVGYTQSDEISLLWYRADPKSQVFFDGKIQKMCSVVAAVTTAIFNSVTHRYWPELVERMLPTFDCRVFQLPTKEEATNAFLWRELDATKNAISMAARHYFSHKALHLKSCAEMQEMLFQEKGINFNDYPAKFKRGTFIRRRTVFKELDASILVRIPEKHRPTGPIERKIIEAMEMPRFSTVENRVSVLFDGAEPITLAPPKPKRPAVE